MWATKRGRELGLMGVGVLTTAVATLFITRHRKPKNVLPTNGTALITGASSGIGAAYAHRLAAEGYDLILTARREARLQTLAEQLRAQHGVTITIIPADLTQEDDVVRLTTAVANCDDLTLLINNAGFGTHGTLAEATTESQVAMHAIHMTTPMRLTKAALPNMIRRNQGAIINVSSIAAFMKSVGNVNYGATKSFLLMFSETLQAELAGTNVKIQALCPGFTVTEFHDTPELASHFNRAHVPPFMWMTAVEVVDISLQALSGTKVVVIPGWVNQLLVVGTGNQLAGLLFRVARKGLALLNGGR